MKHFFVGLVMIISLLLAVSGCSNDAAPQQEPDLEYQGETGDNSDGLKPNETDPPDSGMDGDNSPDPSDEWGADESVPPEFEDFYLFSKKEIRFNFTAAVKCVSCSFTPYQEIVSFQNGEIVKVFLKENLELQTEFQIELIVEDDLDNSLSVQVPLLVNDWVPKIEINELRTEYSSAAKRAEFIEFKTKSTGELDGLRLYIMWDAKNPYYYAFPSVDVKSGEYVTLHLRTLDTGWVDELGEDLAESAGTDSSPTARDLWVSGSNELLHKTDIVYLQDADGRILDAVILNEKPGETWEKNRAHFAGIAEDLYDRGVWKSKDGQPPTPFDAVDTSEIKSSATKSVSRYEMNKNTHTANDWYITDQGGASPGQHNK